MEDSVVIGYWSTQKGISTDALDIHASRIAPLTQTDAVLQQRLSGHYEDVRIGEMYDPSLEQDVEYEAISTLDIDFLHAGHFSFSLETDGANGYLGSANGIAVMVSPDRAIWRDGNACVLNFLFQDSQAMITSAGCEDYAGTHGSLDAELTKE